MTEEKIALRSLLTFLCVAHQGFALLSLFSSLPNENLLSTKLVFLSQSPVALILLCTFSWLAVNSVHSLIPVEFQGWPLCRCRHASLICGLSQGVGGRAEQGVLPPAGPQVVLPARSGVGQQSCCAQGGVEGRAGLAGWLG